ncbi:hypothetical protein [Cellvibrio sp. KY-GH-1]|nr:hypothetical protein [Cellvibrio sp. KY-GH-1]
MLKKPQDRQLIISKAGIIAGIDNEGADSCRDELKPAIAGSLPAGTI